MFYINRDLIVKRRNKTSVKNINFGKTLIPPLSRASLSFVNQESIPIALTKFLHSKNYAKIENELPFLIRSKKVKESMNAYTYDFESMGLKSIHVDLPFKTLISLYKNIYESEEDRLKTYVRLRDEIETALANGCYDKLNELLDQVKIELGESLWYARIKLLSLYLNGEAGEMQDFCTTLKSRTSDSMSLFIIHYFIILTQSIDPRSVIEVVINKQLKELRSAGFIDYANLTQEFLVPAHMKEVKLTPYMLELFQKVNIIDQYNLITSSLMSFLIDVRKELDADDKTVFKGLFNVLQRITNDYKINNFLSSSVLETENELNIHIAKSTSSKYCETPPINTFKGVFYKPIKNLIEIYELSKRSTQSFDELRAHITRLNGTEACFWLESELIKAVPYYITETKAENIEILNSILTRSIVPDELNKLAIMVSADTPPNKTDEINSADLSDCYIYQGNNPELNLGFTKKSIENNIQHFIHDQELDKAINLAAKVLVHKEETYLSLPLKLLIKKVESEFKPTLDYLIVSHFYKKYISSNKSTLHNELFEEYIIANDVTKPSELFLNRTANSKKLDFFFKEICSLETMDFLSDFQNSDELRAERLRLLDYLYTNGTITKDEFYKEADEIVNQFILDSSASHFQISKIYVDEISLKKKLNKEISTLFESYKYAEDSNEDLEVVTLDGDESAPIQAFVRGAKSDILLKSIGLMLEAFLYDENHGLDTNLSTEIRHGFFSNYLRSDLESRRLISEIDADGNFKSMTYWDDMYMNILSPVFLNDITEEFKVFTNGFNEAIREAQAWMKVSSSHEDKNALFIYNVYVNQYDYFKLWMEYCDTAEEFMNEVFSMLWEITDDILILMREKINVDLKGKVQQLFYDLLNRLDLIKGGAVLTDLMSNIIASQNKTSEIISEISDWFNINQHRDFSQQTLSQVINVSINCLEKIKGKNINIKKTFSNELNNYMIDGFTVKKFILALINIFENSIKHSGLNNELQIDIKVYLLDSNICIDIANNLSDQVAVSLTVEKIESLNNLLISPNSLELMREEGGTGLAKASNYMKQASRGYSLKVFCEHQKFITRLLKND